MPVLTRDVELREDLRTDVDPQEFFDRWQEAPEQAEVKSCSDKPELSEHWNDAGRYLSGTPGLNSVLMTPEIRRLNEQVDWASLRPLPAELNGSWEAGDSTDPELETHPPLEWSHVPLNPLQINELYPPSGMLTPTTHVNLGQDMSMEDRDVLVKALQEGRQHNERVTVSIENGFGIERFEVVGWSMGDGPVSFDSNDSLFEMSLDLEPEGGWANANWLTSGFCTPSRDSIMTAPHQVCPEDG